MARSNRFNFRADARQYQPGEGDILTAAPGMQLKGMDKDTPLNLLDPAVARLVRNLCIRTGAYQTRPGTSAMGLPATSPLIAAVTVGLSNLAQKLVRFHETGVDVDVAGVWTPATNTGLYTGLQGFPFAWSGWGDTIMFRAGQGKLFSLAFSPNEITEIADAPDLINHLSVFGTRAVAIAEINNIRGGDVYWSVRADNTDWTGPGSGFEDLKSSPGGRPDVGTAVIPLTDETALLIRTNSIWQINITGDFDAPFAFNRLFEFVGGHYPQLCTAVTRGAIVVDDDHIWLVTLSEVRDIGRPVKSLLKSVAVQQNLGVSSATYDPVYREYRLVLRNNILANERVLRYNFENDAWTEDTYNFPIVFIARDTYNAVQGDNLTLYAVGDTGGVVVRDDITRDNNALRDVNDAGAPVAGGIRIETGDLRRTDASTKKELVEIIAWYEAEAATTLNFEYSYDGGTSWIPLSTLAVGVTTRPTPISVTKTIDRDFIQIACYVNPSPKIRLIKLEAMLREAGKITDAH